jgi:hypothetical protein
MLQHKNVQRLEEMVARIEQFPETSIEEVVNRVPESHIDVAQKETIVRGLIGRRFTRA